MLLQHLGERGGREEWTGGGRGVRGRGVRGEGWRGGGEEGSRVVRWRGGAGRVGGMMVGG